MCSCCVRIWYAYSIEYLNLCCSYKDQVAIVLFPVYDLQNTAKALRSAQEETKVETCLWLNCVASFLYDEWRDSMEVKK